MPSKRVNFLLSCLWDCNWGLNTAKTTKQLPYLILSSSAILIHLSGVVAPAPFCAILEHCKYNKWIESNLVCSTGKNPTCTQSFCYHTYCCHAVVYFQIGQCWTKEVFGVTSGWEALSSFYKYNLSWLAHFLYGGLCGMPQIEKSLLNRWGWWVKPLYSRDLIALSGGKNCQTNK